MLVAVVDALTVLVWHLAALAVVEKVVEILAHHQVILQTQEDRVQVVVVEVQETLQENQVVQELSSSNGHK